MRRALLTSVLTLFLLGSAAPAHAAVAFTGPGSFVGGFLPPVVVIAEGEGITYANSDVAPHNFVAEDAFVPRKAAKKSRWCSSFDPGKCPLFWSPTITTGETTEVEGLAAVKAGDQYAFFCTLHPNMKGTLIVR